MSIQAIINTAQTIEIDRRRVVGQSISRSQRIKTAQRLSAQPFMITITPTARFSFDENRTTLEAIMTADRTQEQQINLSGVSGMNFITEYQGSLNTAQLTALTITNFTGTSMTIGGLPTITGSITSQTVILRAGDFIQPPQSRYPYIVSNKVIRGTGSEVTATTHRSLISSESATLTGTPLIGTNTTMRVLVQELPTYRFVLNNFAEFTGDFVLMEKII